MAFFDRRTASVLTTILAFVGLLALVWIARLPIITFVFALFFAHLLEPVIRRFQGWLHVSRGKAVGLIYLTIFGTIAVFAVTLGPRIMEEGQRLFETLPALFEKIKTGSIAWQFGGQQGWSTETEVQVQNWLISHRDDIAQMARDVSTRLQQLAANIPWILLVPILAVFFLKDEGKLRQSALRSMERPSRDRA